MECSCHKNVVVTIFYLFPLQFRITWKKNLVIILISKLFVVYKINNSFKKNYNVLSSYWFQNAYIEHEFSKTELCAKIQ